MLSKFLESPLTRVSWRYGLISTALCSLYLLSMYYMERHPFLINPFFDFRIPAFGILLFFSLKEVREFHRGGFLYFWEGMAGGFVFTLTAGLGCYFFLILFASAQPAFVASFIEQATDQAKTFSEEDINRIGRTTYEQGLAELKNATSWFMASRYFIQCLIIGFFISIIISVILRRQPKTDTWT